MPNIVLMKYASSTHISSPQKSRSGGYDPKTGLLWGNPRLRFETYGYGKENVPINISVLDLES